ncbi:unnamed protein product [Amoebophrya sp. A120]|nr:unnamed protein product [Amoebophrya sp. A120]|eukprot:GSA120T00008793001.1
MVVAEFLSVHNGYGGRIFAGGSSRGSQTSHGLPPAEATTTGSSTWSTLSSTSSIRNTNHGRQHRSRPYCLLEAGNAVITSCSSGAPPGRSKVSKSAGDSATSTSSSSRTSSSTTAPFTDLKFNGDGSVLATSDRKGGVVLFYLKGNRYQTLIKSDPHSLPINCIEFTRRKVEEICVAVRNVIRCFSVDSRKETARIGGGVDVRTTGTNVKAVNTSSRAFPSSASGVVVNHATKISSCANFTTTTSSSTSVHKRPIFGLRVSSVGGYLLSLSTDIAVLWDVGSWEKLQVVTPMRGNLFCDGFFSLGGGPFMFAGRTADQQHGARILCKDGNLFRMDHDRRTSTLGLNIKPCARSGETGAVKRSKAILKAEGRVDLLFDDSFGDDAVYEMSDPELDDVDGGRKAQAPRARSRTISNSLTGRGRGEAPFDQEVAKFCAVDMKYLVLVTTHRMLVLSSASGSSRTAPASSASGGTGIFTSNGSKQNSCKAAARSTAGIKLHQHRQVRKLQKSVVQVQLGQVAVTSNNAQLDAILPSGSAQHGGLHGAPADDGGGVPRLHPPEVDPLLHSVCFLLADDGRLYVVRLKNLQVLLVMDGEGMVVSSWCDMANIRSSGRSSGQESRSQDVVEDALFIAEKQGSRRRIMEEPAGANATSDGDADQEEICSRIDSRQSLLAHSSSSSPIVRFDVDPVSRYITILKSNGNFELLDLPKCFQQAARERRQRAQLLGVAGGGRRVIRQGRQGGDYSHFRPPGRRRSRSTTTSTSSDSRTAVRSGWSKNRTPGSVAGSSSPPCKSSKNTMPVVQEDSSFAFGEDDFIQSVATMNEGEDDHGCEEDTGSCASLSTSLHGGGLETETPGINIWDTSSACSRTFGFGPVEDQGSFSGLPPHHVVPSYSYSPSSVATTVLMCEGEVVKNANTTPADDGKLLPERFSHENSAAQSTSPATVLHHEEDNSHCFFVDGGRDHEHDAHERGQEGQEEETAVDATSSSRLLTEMQLSSFNFTQIKDLTSDQIGSGSGMLSMSSSFLKHQDDKHILHHAGATGGGSSGLLLEKSQNQSLSESLGGIQIPAAAGRNAKGNKPNAVPSTAHDRRSSPPRKPPEPGVRQPDSRSCTAQNASKTLGCDLPLRGVAPVPASSSSSSSRPSGALRLQEGSCGLLGEVQKDGSFPAKLDLQAQPPEAADDDGDDDSLSYSQTEIYQVPPLGTRKTSPGRVGAASGDLSSLGADEIISARNTNMSAKQKQVAQAAEEEVRKGNLAIRRVYAASQGGGGRTRKERVLRKRSVDSERVLHGDASRSRADHSVTSSGSSKYRNKPPPSASSPSPPPWVYLTTQEEFTELFRKQVLRPLAHRMRRVTCSSAGTRSKNSTGAMHDDEFQFGESLVFPRGGHEDDAGSRLEDFYFSASVQQQQQPSTVLGIVGDNEQDHVEDVSSITTNIPLFCKRLLLKNGSYPEKMRPLFWLACLQLDFDKSYPRFEELVAEIEDNHHGHNSRRNDKQDGTSASTPTIAELATRFPGHSAATYEKLHALLICFQHDRFDGRAVPDNGRAHLASASDAERIKHTNSRNNSHSGGVVTTRSLKCCSEEEVDNINFPRFLFPFAKLFGDSSFLAYEVAKMVCEKFGVLEWFGTEGGTTRSTVSSSGGNWRPPGGPGPRPAVVDILHITLDGYLRDREPELYNSLMLQKAREQESTRGVCSSEVADSDSTVVRKWHDKEPRKKNSSCNYNVVIDDYFLPSCQQLGSNLLTHKHDWLYLWDHLVTHWHKPYLFYAFLVEYYKNSLSSCSSTSGKEEETQNHGTSTRNYGSSCREEMRMTSTTSTKSKSRNSRLMLSTAGPPVRPRSNLMKILVANMYRRNVELEGYFEENGGRCGGGYDTTREAGSAGKSSQIQPHVAAAGSASALVVQLESESRGLLPEEVRHRSVPGPQTHVHYMEQDSRDSSCEQKKSAKTDVRELGQIRSCAGQQQQEGSKLSQPHLEVVRSFQNEGNKTTTEHASVSGSLDKLIQTREAELSLLRSQVLRR